MDRFFNDNKNVLWTTIKKRREESSREKKRMIGACHECVMWWGRVTLGNPSHTAPHRLTEQNENKSRLMVRRCQKVVVSFRFGYFMSFCLFRSYHLSLVSFGPFPQSSENLHFWNFDFSFLHRDGVEDVLRFMIVLKLNLVFLSTRALFSLSVSQTTHLAYLNYHLYVWWLVIHTFAACMNFLCQTVTAFLLS